MKRSYQCHARTFHWGLERVLLGDLQLIHFQLDRHTSSCAKTAKVIRILKWSTSSIRDRWWLGYHDASYSHLRWILDSATGYQIYQTMWIRDGKMFQNRDGMGKGRRKLPKIDQSTCLPLKMSADQTRNRARQAGDSRCRRQIVSAACTTTLQCARTIHAVYASIRATKDCVQETIVILYRWYRDRDSLCRSSARLLLELCYHH